MSPRPDGGGESRSNADGTSYVGLDEARNKGLAWTRGTQFGMTCDTRSIVGDDVRGRDSVRIHSKDWYGTVSWRVC